MGVEGEGGGDRRYSTRVKGLGGEGKARKGKEEKGR